MSIKLYQTTILAALSYGSETWYIKREDIKELTDIQFTIVRTIHIFLCKHMNFRNQAQVCLIKNCKKAQIMQVICLFQSFRKMSPISYVKGIRLY